MLFKAVSIAFLAVLVSFFVWFVNGIVRDFHLTVGWGAVATFTSSAVALLIAGNQQRKADRREALALERRHRGDRAVMPLALSEMHDYVVKCVELLRTTYQNGDAILAGPFEVPELSRDAVNVLRGCAESADEQDADHILRLLMSAQIQKAKLRNLMSKIGTPLTRYNFDARLIDCIRLDEATGSAFNYARRQEEHIVGTPNIFGTLAALQIHEENFQSTYELMRAQKLID